MGSSLTKLTLFKALFIVSLLMMYGCGEKEKDPLEGKAIENQTVTAACGSCKLGLRATSGCELAIQLPEKAYYVEGVETGPHEDFHKPGGYCVSVRKAIVSGEIVNGKFLAKQYELLPMQSSNIKL